MQILKDLGNELDPFYKLNDQLQPKVLELVLENPSSRPGPETFLLGQGEWQVWTSSPQLVCWACTEMRTESQQSCPNACRFSSAASNRNHVVFMLICRAPLKFASKKRPCGPGQDMAQARKPLARQSI